MAAQEPLSSNLRRVAVACIGALVFWCFLSLFIGGASSFSMLVEDGGIFVFAILLWGVIGGGVIAWAGGRRLRGQHIPLGGLALIALGPIALAFVGSFREASQLSDLLLEASDVVMPTMFVGKAVSRVVSVGIAGTSASAILLACVAIIAGFEGLRGKERSIGAAFAVGVTWFLVSGIAVFVGVLSHPDAYLSVHVWSLAYGVAALASGVAAAGLGKGRSAGVAFGALAVPMIGIAIAYLVAYQIRLLDGLSMFTAEAGADLGSRIGRFDRGLFEAAESFDVSLMLCFGPAAAFVVAFVFARRSYGAVLAENAIAAGGLALVLVAGMGVAAVQHTYFVTTIMLLAQQSVGLSDAVRLPDVDVRLPQVAIGETFEEGQIIVFADDVRVDGELIGPRSGPFDEAMLRDVRERDRKLTLMADASMTMPELMSLLAAASGEVEGGLDEVYLEFFVEPPPAELRTEQFRDVESPPSVVRMTYAARPSEGTHLHIAQGSFTLYENGESRDVESVEGAQIVSVSVDATLSLTELLRTFSRICCDAYLTPVNWGAPDDAPIPDYPSASLEPLEHDAVCESSIEPISTGTCSEDSDCRICHDGSECGIPVTVEEFRERGRRCRLQDGRDCELHAVRCCSGYCQAVSH